MNGLLIRVGADQSPGGGKWNGPVNSQTGHFAYAPIPETKLNRPGHERHYSALSPSLRGFSVGLPPHLVAERMHLDPDFEHLTYGDRGRKGKQIANTLGAGDLLIFYAGLMDVVSHRLVYAIIGYFIVDRIEWAVDCAASDSHCNAHTRRQLPVDADDIVVIARAQNSGRLQKCISVGEYCNRAYRVRRDLLEAWGDISSNDGYLQRSAVFPSLLQPHKFQMWWNRQGPRLVRENNPA